MKLSFPKILVALVLMLASLYLICGGIYVSIEGREDKIVNRPWVLVQYGRSQRLSVTYPSLRSQILGEGYVVGVMLMLAVAGFTLPYIGFRFKVDARTMRTMLIASIILIIVSTYLTLSMYLSKYWGTPWP